MEDDKLHLEEDSSSDRSPVSSDSANGSFMNKFWDLQNSNGGCSLATLGSGSNLEGLIDDKDVAAKAVAFVVNTSRKGVVPLCAHIAKILSAKKRLEQTVEDQKQEILKLRGLPSGSGYSGRTSRSTSPTPPSLQLYDETPHHRRRSKGLEHKSSRCSQCSSLSSSPQDSQSLDHHNDPLFSTTSSRLPSDHTPQQGLDHNRGFANRHVIQAEVHTMPVNHRTMLNNPNDSLIDSSLESRLHPVVKVSKEVQCSTLIEQSEELQKKYQQAAQAKIQLELDLRNAKQQIERLKEQLQLKVSDELKDERQRVCEMSIVNEVPTNRQQMIFVNEATNSRPQTMSSPTTNISPSTSPVILPQLNSGGSSPRNHTSNNSSKLGSPRTVILPGCKCTPCSQHQQNGKLPHSSRGHHIVPTPPGGSGSTQHNSLNIHLHDHVSIRGDRTGYVRYIGHIDNATNPQAIYVGVQLDLPVGTNNGSIHGKQYFWCHRNHGIFLLIEDVTKVISRKPSKKRPKTGEMIRKHSTDSDSSSNNNSTKPIKQNGYPMKRNKAGQQKRLISADSRNLILPKEIQPQPPVST